MSGTCNFVIPRDVHLCDLTTGNSLIDASGKQITMSFTNFIIKILDLPDFTSNIRSLRMANEVFYSLKEKNPGDSVTLSKDDWREFSNIAVENFNKVFTAPANILIQLMPFFEVLSPSNKD